MPSKEMIENVLHQEIIERYTESVSIRFHIANARGAGSLCEWPATGIIRREDFCHTESFNASLSETVRLGIEPVTTP